MTTSLKSILPFPLRSSYRPLPSGSDGKHVDEVRGPAGSPEPEKNSIGKGQIWEADAGSSAGNGEGLVEVESSVGKGHGGDWDAGSSAGNGEGLVEVESSVGKGHGGDWDAESSAGNGEGFDVTPESSNGEIYPTPGSSEKGHNSSPATPEIIKNKIRLIAGANRR